MQIPSRTSRARVVIFCLFSTVLLASSCPDLQDVKGLNVKIEGGGTVTPCCASIHKTGTTVQLTETPDLGWVFKGWYGNAGAGVSTAATLDVLMDRDKEIRAVFEPLPINENDLKSSGR